MWCIAPDASTVHHQSITRRFNMPPAADDASTAHEHRSERRWNSSGTTRPASILQQYVQEKPQEICLTRLWRIPFKVLPHARLEAYWRHIGSAAPIVPVRAPFLVRLYAAVTVPTDRSKECASRITFRTYFYGARLAGHIFTYSSESLRSLCSTWISAAQDSIYIRFTL